MTDCFHFFPENDGLIVLHMRMHVMMTFADEKDTMLFMEWIFL